MIYSWIGVNQQGQKVNGEFSGSRSQLILELKKHGISCLKVKRKIYNSNLFAKKISAKILAEFTRQLSILFNANIEFVSCLHMLSQENEFPALRVLIIKITNFIVNGMSIAEALNKFPNYFEPSYCALIHAAERSGTLKEILNQLSNFQNHKLKTRFKVIKAVYYPVVILSISLIITFALLIFVVPQFKNIFDSFGAKLPGFTLSVIGFSKFLQQNCLLIIEVLLILFITNKKIFVNSASYKKLIHGLILRLPGVGNFLCIWYAANWMRLLAILLNAGIPLIDTIELSIPTIPNLYYQNILSEIKQSIHLGNSFLYSIRGKFIFPSRAVQMIGIGESAGQLTRMLLEAADILEVNIEHKIDAFAEWLEPMLMVLLAILVGGLIIAMYLPVFRLGSAL